MSKATHLGGGLGQRNKETVIGARALCRPRSRGGFVMGSWHLEDPDSPEGSAHSTQWCLVIRTETECGWAKAVS